MKIGYIPGALDMLSGEYFPHLVHMRENVTALRRRVEVNLITAGKANAQYSRLRQRRVYNILNRRHIHILRKLFHLCFFLAAYREIKREINGKQNDLFIVRHSFSSNYLVCRYLQLKGWKVLLEVHALAQVEEKSYGQTHIPRCLSHLYFLVVSKMEMRMFSWADAITTVSASLKSRLVDLGIDEGKIHAIHNGVDPEAFLLPKGAVDIRQRYDLAAKNVVGFVGSFALYHGVDILPYIAGRLEREYENVVFLLVGGNVHGPGNPREQVSARGLSSRFIFVGEVPHSMIPHYVEAMDVAIIPDFNDYGSPMKLFEYMAMRKAVVAPDVPPIREVVEDGHTAILFEKRNVHEATKAIERLLEDESLRKRLGQKAYDKVMSSYTWDSNADKIVQIAHSMVEEERPCPQGVPQQGLR
jgi:glycosyltransferase involved in cell wall biosynthesis